MTITQFFKVKDLEPELKLYFKKTVLFGLLLNFICAIFSFGFLHPDEHYQVVEFMNLKLGGIGEQDMPWDYNAEIRPWTQVWLFWLFHKGANFIGITSPFWIMTIIRVFCSMLGVYALNIFTFSYLKDLKSFSAKKLLIFSTSFLWFIPFIHARTSAENLAASCTFFALYLFKKVIDEKKFKDWLSFCLIGCFFGYAFLFRMQMGIVAFFVSVWFLVKYKKEALAPFAVISSLILFSLFDGLIFDYFGYGKWTFTPYNYFYQNIVMGVAAKFGVDPWWYYLKKMLLKGAPPLTLFMLASAFFVWKKEKASLITMATVPFLVIHSLIGHKEVRFLFYLYLWAPIFLALAYDEYKDSEFLKKNWVKKFWKFSLGVNYIFLLFILFKPAHTPLKFYKFLYDNHPEVNSIHVLKEGKHADHLTLSLHYYKHPGINLEPYWYDDLKEKLSENRGYVLTSKYKEYLNMKKDFSRCQLKYSNYPEWLFNFNFFNWLKRSSVWAFWKC